MANALGVHSVLASYGVSQSSPAYQLLQDVSHWSDEEILAGESVSTVEPDFELPVDLGELLDLFNFGSARPDSSRSIAREASDFERSATA